jgi:hypothetical protein
VEIIKYVYSADGFDEKEHSYAFKKLSLAVVVAQRTDHLTQGSLTEVKCSVQFTSLY